ncbi:MAG TPA: amidohydrolase family protein [Candidatus Sumerlaeota bacterium]|nr:MAG: Amidohydrolase [candidate division BRC1 bacterium ADurb.BinA292]HOE96526.1 amidohydrolase family protein [Candidatus Sumerlaeota bacterium]HOR26528.1 amidohydrolase family protein [Candidatus Sumerlaeota bacterium]HPK01275.1 amidohydrolase family protein [Candidatus Sumerlaeota bacterium]
MVVIDAHCHLMDTRVPGFDLIAHKWGGKGWGGGVDDLLAQMDEAGIDHAFLLTSTVIDVMAHFLPEKRDDILRCYDHFVNKACYWRDWELHRDRFTIFADSIDPRVPGYVERAEQDLDRGAKGLKMLPSFTDTTIDDPRWDPIFDLMKDRDVPGIVDLTYWYLRYPWFAPSLHGRFRNFEEFAETVHRRVEKSPGVRLEITHFGTPEIFKTPIATARPGDPVDYDSLQGPIDMIRPHPELICGLANYHMVIPADEPFPYPSGLKIVQILKEELGADRLTFGTDWPYLEHRSQAELIRSLRAAPFLTPDDVDMILGGTAFNMLKGNLSTADEPVSSS